MAVTVRINHRETLAAPGESLFDCAERMKVRIPTSCFKQGKCQECLVELVQGMELLSPREPEEAHLLEPFRLSCRARVTGAEGRIHCHTLRRGSLRIEERAIRLPVSASPPPLEPAVRREGPWVLLHGEGVERSTGPLYGIALDLGTTTVVVRLVNLETGRIAASHSFENPQRFAGSDVMARITHDRLHRGRLLKRTLIGYLNHALEELPCLPEQIYEVVVAGNATMRDLFFGLNVQGIGQKPYRSVTEEEFLAGRRPSTSLSAPARRLGLRIHPKGSVYGLPLVGCHVGADAAAGLLAVNFDRQERLVALMDIGTNTELIVGNRRRALAASCPAGPAFEGGLLACGMPGLEGAVEGVRIRKDGSLQLRVIGNTTPEGICGSGLVEALGELRRTGRMNSLGRFTNGHPRLYLDEAANLFLDEKDVSLLAQAKAAQACGLSIVLKRYGIEFSDLEIFYLAGAFGRHLDREAARRIGLLPDLPDEKILQVGNVSIEGATLALLSMSRRRELESFVPSIGHVELETDPDFFDHFVEGCHFLPLQTRSPQP